MNEDLVHYHCLICEKSFDTKQEAEECFKNHNKEDHLIYVFKEIYWIRSYLYEMLEHLDFIERKYNIDE